MPYKDSIMSQVVRRIAADKYTKLFVDEHGDPYIAPNGDGTQVYAIGSGTFNDWLMPFVMDNFEDRVLTSDQLKNVVDTLRGYAKYRGEGEIKLSLRVHADEYGNFWYDLGREAVKIMPDKWQVEVYPPITFVRFADCQKKQVMPELGGNAMDLFKFINIKDKYDRLLTLSFAIFSLVPFGNKPILSLSGQAGSGKTEASKIIKSLVDPTVPLVGDLSDKTDELDRMAQTNAVMAFDNLSSLSNKMSDHWCRLATGLGVRIKKYYVTSEYITFEAIRPIIANGISQTLIQSDILNRSVPVELAKLDHRTDEQEFRERFELEKPKLLGALFTVLSKAMAVYPNVPKREWPRMGSFAKWTWAIAEVVDGYCGDDAIVALDRISEIQHDEAVDANPVAQVLTLFMEGKKTWQGTATDLLYVLERGHDERTTVTMQWYSSKVENLLRSPYWPKDPRALSMALKKVVPDLKSLGITVQLGIRENNRRIIRVENRPVIDGTMPEYTVDQYLGLRDS